MQKKTISQTIRILCLLCCLILTLAMFAGCKKDNDTVSSKKENSSQTSSLPKTDVVSSYENQEHPTLPKNVDLNGFEMSFALPQGHFFLIRPEKGENAQNDLVLEALEKIEQEYDCKVSLIPVNDWTTEVMPSLLAGDEFAKVIMPYVHQAGQFVSARLCMNMLTSDISQYINMDQPWWNSTIAYAANVDGKVYAGAPDIQSTADSTMVCFFNKRILKEIGSDEKSIYKMYYDKTWTWDVFRDLAKKAVKDLNNDSTMDNKDRFGFTAPDYDSAEAFCTTADCISIVTKNGKNPTYNYTTPFAISTLMTLNSLYTEDGIYFAKSNTKEEGSQNWAFIDVFARGQSLFMCHSMSAMAHETIREMDDQIGMMPMPLGPTSDTSDADGWRNEYSSRVNHNFRVTIIPTTNKDIADTALVLEAIAFNYWRLTNQRTEIYGAVYLNDDDAAYIATQIYNYSTFEISQFLYSINNGVYNNEVLSKVYALTQKPQYDVTGEFASVAETAQIIINQYFAGE